jgi:predicted tellurium resistance membrane protein TerC
LLFSFLFFLSNLISNSNLLFLFSTSLFNYYCWSCDWKKQKHKVANQEALKQLEQDAIEHYREKAQQLFRVERPVIIRVGEGIEEDDEGKDD